MAGIWDVDALASEIPQALLSEWGEYLNHELSRMAEAIVGVLPLVGGLGGGGASAPRVITDPAEKAAFFDQLIASQKQNGQM